MHKIETLSTIGAGDNFNAGVVYTLSQLPALAALTLGREEWDKIVTTAHLFSAEVCQSYENYVPEDFLKRYNL